MSNDAKRLAWALLFSFVALSLNFFVTSSLFTRVVPDYIIPSANTILSISIVLGMGGKLGIFYVLIAMLMPLERATINKSHADNMAVYKVRIYGSILAVAVMHIASTVISPAP